MNEAKMPVQIRKPLLYPAELPPHFGAARVAAHPRRDKGKSHPAKPPAAKPSRPVLASMVHRGAGNSSTASNPARAGNPAVGGDGSPVTYSFTGAGISLCLTMCSRIAPTVSSIIRLTLPGEVLSTEPDQMSLSLGNS